MILNHFLCSLVITCIFSENDMNTFQDDNRLTKSKTTELKSNNDKTNQARKKCDQNLGTGCFLLHFMLVLESNLLLHV